MTESDFEVVKVSKDPNDLIYRKLAERRKLFITGEITTESATVLVADLLFLDSVSNDIITIYINSTGGDVEGALLPIYDTIETIKSPVSTVAVGQAFSSAAIILSAGTKGLRLSNPNAHIMLHGVQSSELYGTQSDIEKESKIIKRLNNCLMEIIAKHSGKNIRKIKRDCKTDKYLTAKEALEYGIIDRIISK